MGLFLNAATVFIILLVQGEKMYKNLYYVLSKSNFAVIPFRHYISKAEVISCNCNCSLGQQTPYLQ